MDLVSPVKYRVGVMPQTRPPSPPTYSTYSVVLGKRADKIVSIRTGRVMAKGMP